MPLKQLLYEIEQRRKFVEETASAQKQNELEEQLRGESGSSQNRQ